MRMTHSAAKGRSFRATSRARLLATAVFIGAATASAPFLTPAFAQVFSFSNVTIEGNVRVDSATILNYAGISRGEEVSAGGLNDAYQRILNSGLFETVELVPQGSTLLIRVVEYPIVNVISIEGNKRLKDEQKAAEKAAKAEAKEAEKLAKEQAKKDAAAAKEHDCKRHLNGNERRDEAFVLAAARTACGAVCRRFGPQSKHARKRGSQNRGSSLRVWRSGGSIS